MGRPVEQPQGLDALQPQRSLGSDPTRAAPSYGPPTTTAGLAGTAGNQERRPKGHCLVAAHQCDEGIAVSPAWARRIRSCSAMDASLLHRRLDIGSNNAESAKNGPRFRSSSATERVSVGGSLKTSVNISLFVAPGTTQGVPESFFATKHNPQRSGVPGPLSNWRFLT